MQRPLTIAGIVLVVAFLGLQLVRPELESAPAPAELVAPPAAERAKPPKAPLAAPPNVRRILETSCYDCHSSATRLRWFDQIVPAYWLVVDDVRRGRARLDFSNLASLPVPQQLGALYDAVNQARLGAMPIWLYTVAHPGTALDRPELETLERWLVGITPPPPSGAARAATADAQRTALAARLAPPVLRPAPNGVELPRDWASWKVINSTERFDNATLRQILGNDVAIRAIEDGKTNPWPDGSMFAKIAWETVRADDGTSRPGAFFQVELMRKDAERYDDTAGWGWGRWRGADLQPYGTSAAFTGECVGCHAPMRDRDFVYTMPVARDLPGDPLAGGVLAMTVDAGASTMSTSFGNDVAVSAARSGAPYPAGSVVSLVTWRQQADAHWFGARIPADAVSVEVVRVGASGGADYEAYGGAPLQPAPAPDPATRENRVREIVGAKTVILP